MHLYRLNRVSVFLAIAATSLSELKPSAKLPELPPYARHWLSSFFSADKEVTKTGRVTLLPMHSQRRFSISCSSRFTALDRTLVTPRRTRCLAYRISDASFR